MLFRLGLFVALYLMLRVVRIPGLIALVLAACAGAVAFAAAHHIGPYGEPMRADYFVFRTAAGLYFTALFVVRGFGIAVMPTPVTISWWACVRSDRMQLFRTRRPT